MRNRKKATLIDWQGIGRQSLSNAKATFHNGALRRSAGGHYQFAPIKQILISSKPTISLMKEDSSSDIP